MNGEVGHADMRGPPDSLGLRDIGAFGFHTCAFGGALLTAASASLAMWDLIITGQPQPLTVLH